MKILQRNLYRSTFVVWEMMRNVSVVCACSVPNCCDMEQRSASQPACFLPDAPLCWSLCHLTEGACTIRLFFVSVSVNCEFTQDSWKMYPYILEEWVFIVRTYLENRIDKVMSTAISGEVWRQMMSTSSTCYEVFTFLTQRKCDRSKLGRTG
jgi:hypothetical protein